VDDDPDLVPLLSEMLPDGFTLLAALDGE